ncbi:hypothetical protein HDU88_009036 [Geranomyces variabilis]|nr:hypothetical protein HDU88_009036 [Geranomyces variabilis]
MNQDFRHAPIWGLEWVGNIGDRGGAQAFVIANLKANHFPIHITHKHHRKWWSGVTKEQLLKLITDDRGVYEVLMPTLPRKVYFDVDKTSISLHEIQEIILQYFPNAYLNISGRLKPEVSVHIVLSNYYAKNLDATLPLKLIALKHKEQGFDPSVYTKNRNFKCIHQAKVNQPVQEWIAGSLNDQDHLVMHGINFETATDISTMSFDGIAEEVKKKTKHSSLALDTQIDILSIPQRNLPCPENFDIMTAFPLDLLGKLPNPRKGTPGCLHHNLIWQVMCWAKQAGITYDDFWSWNGQKNDSALRYKSWLKEWNTCAYKISSKVILAMLERTYPKIMETQVTKRFREQFNIDDVKIISEDYLQASDIAHWKKTKFSILVAPMGANKTGSVIDYLAKMCKERDFSVLWISSRITLAQNTLQRLQENGLSFANYKDFTKPRMDAGELDDEKYLICSIQSLHHLTRNYDIVIADEWDTTAASFAKDCKTHVRDTISNLAHNWNVWMSQLRQAKKVIIMDAFTTKLTVNFLEHFRQDESALETKTVHIGEMPLTVTRAKRSNQKLYEIVNVQRSPAPRQFLESDTFDDWFSHVLKALEDGKKCYIFCPFKQGKIGVEQISSMICKHMNWTEGNEIKVYHALKDQEKKALLEVEKVWSRPEVRCVVTNGAISVGVNFNLENVFDQIFAIYSPIISVRDFFQALYRVRKPNSPIMHLYREKSCLKDYKIDDTLLPNCEVFRQLRRDLKIEELANQNYKSWETFNFFCELANVSILPKHVEQISKNNRDYLHRLAKNVDCKFDWNKIPLLPSDTPEEVILKFQTKIWGNNATMDERLVYQKYCFNRLFNDTTADYAKHFLWKKSPNLPSQLKVLKHKPDHLISKLFEENSIVLDDFEGFPDAMTTTCSLEAIQKTFHFHNPPKDYRTHLVSRMLEAFFERKVYTCKPQSSRVKNDKGKYEVRKVWRYVTNADFITCINIVVQGILKKDRIDILADSDE